MEDSQKEQIIVILSPQSWNHQFISKHHYAVEFSKLYNTIFVSPTLNQVGKLSFTLKSINEYNSNLTIAQMVLPLPNWFRFKFNNIYRIVNRYLLNYFLRKNLDQDIKLLLDFGCHKSIDRLDKFQSYKTIYFPVDDYIDLPIERRFADKIFTVSSKIQEKFETYNIPITWINHGLSSVFAEKAMVKLEELKKIKETQNIVYNKIGYSGNLTIHFLDRPAVLDTIMALPDFEFHFFGSYSTSNLDAKEFISKLKKFNNVILYGQVSTEKLADYLFQMDILWLCYNVDGKNYHLENSHKILEYLSTGKPFISSPIKYLENADKNFVYQFKNNRHAEIIKNFVAKEEGLDLILNRIEFSLNSTYSKNISCLLS